MTALVLDASIALSWCFADEASPATWDVLEMLQKDSALVPSIWALEVSNILSAAERQSRLTEAKTLEFLHLLEQLNIAIDPDTATHAFHEILHLSRMYNLSAYDAAYLELAMRLGAPLATKDKTLRKVCSKLGLKALPAKL